MPTMNAISSSDETIAGRAGEQPQQEADAEHHLDEREQVPHGRHRRLGQQVVGTDGAHARRRVGQLQGAGDEPDPARHQPGHQPEPLGVRLLHGTHPRVASLRLF